jgi:hypothetical protein
LSRGTLVATAWWFGFMAFMADQNYLNGYRMRDIEALNRAAVFFPFNHDIRLGAIRYYIEEQRK